MDLETLSLCKYIGQSVVRELQAKIAVEEEKHVSSVIQWVATHGCDGPRIMELLPRFMQAKAGGASSPKPPFLSHSLLDSQT
jgi:hypothetical protein